MKGDLLPDVELVEEEDDQQEHHGSDHIAVGNYFQYFSEGHGN
jgi:hypothetical protein